ncbi:response regulator transcription factor [Streptomyces sp. NA04227]|uniref:helix-turn-helix transcriptional regulator n=1 Tax=Streptomyces sp. NA04227 TaxID=2742136 RepID=UPI001590CE22|nr:response regulator transcription factor [Streptomyces sp. NA04227]QKW10455.1 response regulator transcription factor [Streptomyces sp. NA04227]
MLADGSMTAGAAPVTAHQDGTPSPGARPSAARRDAGAYDAGEFGPDEYRVKAYGVVLVEPHVVTRMGVLRMLEQAMPGAAVLAVSAPEEVSDAELALPATVVLSSGVLGRSLRGLENLIGGAETRLVILARGLDRRRWMAAARLPVDAILREEDLSVSSLADALGAIGRGTVAVSRDTMRELLSFAAEAGGDTAPPRPTLTARELDTLRLMSSGLSNRQIAKGMQITEHGVKRHVANVLAKLGCQNRTMAVAAAMRRGLVEIDSETPG